MLARKLPGAPPRSCATPTSRPATWAAWARPSRASRAASSAARRSGLVGFGAVGRAVARRLRGFGARVLVYDPLRRPRARSRSTAREAVALDELLAASDFVSLHAPVTDATRGLIGGRRARAHEAGRRRSSTPRARRWSTRTALARRARVGRASRGAALDVFAVEPPGADHPLLALENVIATPHVGGNTVDVAAHQGRIVAEDLARLLRGERAAPRAEPRGARRLRLRAAAPARPTAAALARLAAAPGARRLRPAARPQAGRRPAAAAAPPPRGRRSCRPRRGAAHGRDRSRGFVARARASPRRCAPRRSEREVTLHFRLPDLGRELCLRLRAARSRARSARPKAAATSSCASPPTSSTACSPAA